MFKNYKLLEASFLLLGLGVLLGACGGSAVDNSTFNANSSRGLMGGMEEYLNEGKSSEAAELFRDEAILVIRGPIDPGSEKMSDYYNQGGYFIALAYKNDQTVYRGKEKVKSFLVSLPQRKFRYTCNTLSEDADEVTWGCWTDRAGLHMKFKAGVEEGKINLLVVTNS